MSDSPREIAVNQGALAFQRREALTQLIKEAPADLFEILEIAVQSEDPYFRRDVVKIAASAPEEVACRFLQKALCDENDYVRQDATHTLVERFGEECRDELEKLLGDRSYSVRSAAEAALRKFGKQPTAEAIPAPPPTEPDPVVEHAQERPPRSDSETVDKPKEDPHPASAPPSLKNPTHTIAPSGVSISLLERFFQGTLSDHLADCSELEKLLGQLRIQNHQDQKN